MTLQIEQKRAESASTLERKVINTKLGNRPNRLGRQGHHAPENGLARGLYAQPISDTHAQPAAGRQANDLHDVKQALRDSCKGIHKGGQALHTDFAETVRCLTQAFAHLHQKTNVPPATGQVGHLTQIAAMYPCGWFATERTARVSLC